MEQGLESGRRRVVSALSKITVSGGIGMIVMRKKEKETCREFERIADACRFDSSGGVDSFLLQLVSEFASNVQCSGVEVAKLDGPASFTNKRTARIIQEPHLTLSVHYVPGIPTLNW